MKKTALALFFFALGALSCPARLRAFELFHWGADRLAQILSSALGEEVRIGSMTTNFWNEVVLSNVSVKGPLSLTCPELKVRFSLINLLVSKEKPEWGLARVTLNHPLVVLRSLPQKQGPTGPPAGLLPLWISWEDAEVVVLDKSQAWNGGTLKGLHGWLEISRKGLQVETEVASPGHGQALLQGRCALGKDRHWSAFLKVNDVDLVHLQKSCPPALLKRLPGQVSGALSGKFQANGIFPLDPRKIRWQSSGVLRHATWHPPEAKGALPFEGRFEADAGRMRIREGLVARGLALEGLIMRPWSGDPEFNMALRGKAVDLAFLRRCLSKRSPWQHFPVSGFADFDATLRGKPNHLKLEGPVSLTRATVSGTRLPAINGRVRLDGPTLDLALNAFGGKLAAQGSWEAARTALKVSGTNLDLLALAQANGWRNIGGIVNLSLDVQGPPDNLSAHGKLEINRFAWGSHREEKSIETRLLYRDAQLSLQSEGDALFLEAGLEGEKIALRRFHLISSQDLWIKGSGFIVGPEKTLDLQVEVKGLPVTDWPSFATRYPQAKGHCAFQGEAKGTLKNPAFHGRFSVPDLALQPNSKTWHLEGTLGLEGDALTLDDVTANVVPTTLESPPVERQADQYQLQLRWTPAQQSGEVKLFLREADPSFFREAALLTPTLSGRVTGEARFNWNQDHWQAARVKGIWKKGNLGILEFEDLAAEFKGSVDAGFQLNELKIQQSSGTFSGGGNFFPAKPGCPWKITGQFKKAALSRLVVDGELEMHGFYDSRSRAVCGSLFSPSLFLNDYSLGSVQARLSWDKTSLRISDLFVSGGFKGDLEASLVSHGLRGELIAQDQDLKGILLRFLPETRVKQQDLWPSGKVQAEMQIGGTWEDVRCDSTLSVTSGLWRQVPFQAEMQLSYDHKFLTLQPLKIDFPEEGEATFEGFLDFDSPEPTHVYGEIVSMPIARALQLLGLPPLWSGVAQGVVQLEGPLEHPKVTAAIAGQRDAWGPIPAGPIQARLYYDGRVWNIPEAFIGAGDGHIRLSPGSFVYSYSPGMGRTRLVADVRNIHLGPVTFFGGLEVAGQWTVSDGEARVLNWDLAMLARGLWLNQQRLDGELARCEIQQGHLVFRPSPIGSQKLSGEISFEAGPLVEIKKLVLAQGNQTRVELSGVFFPHDWTYSLACQEVEAETLASLFDVTFPIHGQVDLVMSASGLPEIPHWEGSFLWTQGTVYGMPFDTARAHFSLFKKIFSIKKLRASRNNGYVLSGECQFPAETSGGNVPSVVSPSFKVLLEEGDLNILKDIWPSCRKARGQFNGMAQMKTVGGRSILEGSLNIRDAHVDADRYFQHLTEGQATLLLRKNRLTINELSARIGEGRAAGGGWVDFEGLAPSEYHLSLETSGERGIGISVPQLAIPPGPLLKKFSLFQKALTTISRGEPKLELVLDGPSDDHRIKGIITLNNTTFTYPPPPGQTGEKPPQWWTDFLNTTHWDVTFVTGDKTRYENELVDVGIAGSLTLQGRLAQPVVISHLTSDQGAFVYAGEEFRIRHAAFDIETSTSAARDVTENDSPITPFLQAEAEKDVFVPGGVGPDTVIMTIPRAPLGQIQPHFQLKSNPGLGSEKAMQLALGLPVTTPDLVPGQPLPGQLSGARTEQDQYLRAAVVQLFDASFASPLTRAIARRSGLVDYIRVYYQPTEEPPASTGEPQRRSVNYLKGSGLSFGKELTRRLFANYKFHVDEFQNRTDLKHEFELAYRLKNNLFLKASTDLSPQEAPGQLPDRRAILENQWRFVPPGFETAAPSRRPKMSK